MESTSLGELIEASDLAGLSRFIDGACSSRDWNLLEEVRDRCDEAVERGKQLWGISQYAEYRLALDAPASFAAKVLTDGRGRFTLGPLWEVAASTHTWEDLAPHLTIPTTRAMAAHERSIRGDVVPDDDYDRDILSIPASLQPWEPEYPVAEYRPDRATFPEDGHLIPMEWIGLPKAPPSTLDDDGVSDALLDLVRPWWDDSLGKAETAIVEGSIEQAIATLGLHRVRFAETDLGTAMAAMTWAGASGGGHGRRRGTPTGRAGAWWVLLEALEYDAVPDDPSVLGEEASALRWVLWEPGEHISGWNLHIGIEDPEDGLAWILAAVDSA